MPLIFFSLAAGLLFGRLSAGTRNDLRIRLAKVDGRLYRVAKRGRGAYEVFRDDNPAIFLMLNQTGETASSSPGPELEQLRADMRKFPATLFDA